MSIRHEHNNGAGGGGSSTEVTIFSSRNTIDATEVSAGEWDINVAGEDSIRFLVHNFKELMEAFVTVGEMYTEGNKTSCVIQLMNDIDMTSPTEEDEELYKVYGNKLIDRTNYTYNLRLYLRYTTILSDGKQRILQLLYPYANKTKLDIWSFKSEILSIDNVGFGGTSSTWNTLHPSESPISVGMPPIFTRYLLTSDGNVSYTLKNSSFPVCGASATNNGYNPFIYEGSGNNRPRLYHTRYEIIGCSFLTGTDPGGGHIWADTYAPIVINATYMENYQRVLVVERCSKAIGNNANDTGVPNIQIWSPSAQADSPWQVTSDGTALISHQYGSSSLLLKTRLALNDLYLQGTPLTPAGNPPTENYVSLVAMLLDLLQNAGGVDIQNDSDPLNGSEFILYQTYSTQNNHDIKRKNIASFDDRAKEAVGRYDFSTDDHGNTDGRMFLLTEVKSTTTATKTIEGMIYGGATTDSPAGYLQNIFVTWENVTGEVKSTLLQNTGNIVAIIPAIVQYNSKYYIALKQFGKDYPIRFIGRVTYTPNDVMVLYYKSDVDKWYSDQGRTTEITVTDYITAGRMPASIDFGGTTAQAIAGDGSFLDWDSKLGYWKGTQQQYEDLPANEKDIPNVLYVII